jgi:hypothetical protein
MQCARLEPRRQNFVFFLDGAYIKNAYYLMPILISYHIQKTNAKTNQMQVNF